MWVEPDLRIGPVLTKTRDLFSDFWGHDAELRGPYGGRDGREEVEGRLTPLRGLMALQANSQSDENPVAIPESQIMMVNSQTQSTGIDKPWYHCESLKELLEAVTGQPPERQKLVCGVAGHLDDDSKTLCQYDIGHGALVLFSLKRKPGDTRDADVQSLRNIKERVESFERCAPGRNEWMNTRDCSIEYHPDWENHTATPLEPPPSPPEIYWNDYLYLRDNSSYDVVGQIRRRSFFKQAPKSLRRGILPPMGAQTAR
jgi:hypothetical protein